MRHTLFLALATTLLLAACSDDGGDSVDPRNPDEVVPPAPLAGDISACPGDYATTAPAAGWNRAYNVANQDREFFLTLPTTGTGPRPLLVAYNGTGGNGEGFTQSAHLQDFADCGFIVVAPSSNANGLVWAVWDGMRTPANEAEPNPDMDLFDSLIDCLAAHHEVDANRLYVTGHSAGGIMANYTLQRRDELLAGGIVASGAIDATTPSNAQPLDPMTVVLTFGGDTDQYSGESDGGGDINEFDFKAQASLASNFYSDETSVNMALASQEVGHKWLFELNDWMIDILLANPKDFTNPDGFSIPAVPAGVTAAVTTEPFDIEVLIEVVCEVGTVSGCDTLCQFIGDCVIENNTLRGPLADQLGMFGFTGEEYDECPGCVSTCDAAVGETTDTALECLVAAKDGAVCGQGVNGADPFIGAINTCCEGQTDSPTCQMLCEAIATNDVAVAFFTSCEAFGTGG